MGMILSNVAPLLARLALAVLFFYAAWQKFSGAGRVAGLISSHVLPVFRLGIAESSLFWRVTGLSAGVLEATGAFLLLLGLRTRFAGLSLAGYLVAVTVFMHAFPARAAGDSLTEMTQLMHLFKNGAVIACLLLLAGQGPGWPSFDQRR